MNEDLNDDDNDQDNYNLTLTRFRVRRRSKLSHPEWRRSELLMVVKLNIAKITYSAPNHVSPFFFVNFKYDFIWNTVVMHDD